MTIREKFALSRDEVRHGLENLHDYPHLTEAVILSTCNRSEVYAVVDEDYGAKALKTFWNELTQTDENIDNYCYEFVNEECIRHLFGVSGGLDSLILGEGQILSQVKAAYALAKQAAATDTILNTLFNRAIATGKRIRTETRIAYNSVSVSYAAAELAQKCLGSLRERRALIFGAGKMARLTAQHLLARHIDKIYVANRHLDKAETLAEEIGGEAVSFADALQAGIQTDKIDIIVTSTGAPHYVLKAPQTKQLMEKRHGRKLFVIDIAVPRDVEPEVGEIPGVTLYNIDDLEAVVDKNRALRQSEAVTAQRIVDEEVESVQAKFQYLAVQPIMASLSARSEKIRQYELKRARAKLTNLNENEWRQVDNLSHMIVRKLLRVPMMNLTMAAGTEREDFYAEAYQALFKPNTGGEMSQSGYHRYRYAQQ